MTLPILQPGITGAAFDAGVPAVVEQLNQQMVAQRAAQLTQFGRIDDEIRRKLTQQRAEGAFYQADRAIANAKSQRLMGALSSKFSLISKIQQNIG
ncbi:hypothetical protein ACVIHI_009109 [Bradyrhizobium sp. USDA 4524]|uniref:hypothetical protein n=1 Tax=unclassified Bradyrhizobium TaxID=2631580 RepID=UPI0020A03666|nr:MULTISPECIES: hypothetical protein [unclassified Bradyrhizobium]MCP1846112.1 hypothetical protein [Bradyrhizobium sp. USDA 4538]MCP1907253.1 hypothetical protein [Bradyrhizobium sp. USDA 4537]MCP1985729.1 hypothetical protein [Bradyrhizobium sp. USDA 4539]